MIDDPDRGKNAYECWRLQTCPGTPEWHNLRSDIRTKWNDLINEMKPRCGYFDTHTGLRCCLDAEHVMTHQVEIEAVLKWITR